MGVHFKKYMIIITNNKCKKIVRKRPHICLTNPVGFPSFVRPSMPSIMRRCSPEILSDGRISFAAPSSSSVTVSARYVNSRVMFCWHNAPCTAFQIIKALQLHYLVYLNYYCALPPFLTKPVHLYIQHGGTLWLDHLKTIKKIYNWKMGPSTYLPPCH
jgi:hypothetical protein